jgi:hypothetical protein
MATSTASLLVPCMTPPPFRSWAPLLLLLLVPIPLLLLLLLLVVVVVVEAPGAASALTGAHRKCSGRPQAWTSQSIMTCGWW